MTEKRFLKTNEIHRVPKKTKPMHFCHFCPISSLSLWPPNSQDLNPADYKIWGLVHERVYQQPVSTERTGSVWEAVDQRVIDAAIVRQWRERLHACVKANGGHFEHLLK